MKKIAFIALISLGCLLPLLGCIQRSEKQPDGVSPANGSNSSTSNDSNSGTSP